MDMFEESTWDVLVVGGGPAGLAAAARLREPTPSALFTDEEHRRYHWIHRHRLARSMSIKNCRTGKVSRPNDPHSSSISQYQPHNTGITSYPVNGEKKTNSSSWSLRTLILDATAPTWMARWDAAFQHLDISHLRSPMFFHVDPADRDSLLALAASPLPDSTPNINGWESSSSGKNRMGELIELRGCVGKEISKHGHKKRRSTNSAQKSGGMRRQRPNTDPEIDERERNDYFAPSRELFRDHCAEVVRRYELNNAVKHENVTDIVYDAHAKIFKVSTTNISTTAANVSITVSDDTEETSQRDGQKSCYKARTVILAIGPGSTPNYPLLQSLNLDTAQQDEKKQWIHSSQIRGPFPDTHIQSLILRKQYTRIVVVGAGLTAAQLCDLAARRGVDETWLLSRSASIRVRPFDVELPWLGKYRNHEHAAFWLADSDKERLEFMREARGGGGVGSVTPAYWRRIKAHQKNGKVKVRTGVVVKDMQYIEATGRWRVFIVSSSSSSSGGDDDNKEDTASLIEADFVYFATGHKVDVEQVPCLRTMREEYPIETCAGLPCLTQDLAWRDDVPLFVTGRLAALRLGPGAGNLIGARTGAERLAWAMEEVAERRVQEGVIDEEAEEENERLWGLERDYMMGVGSKFGVLGEA